MTCIYSADLRSDEWGGFELAQITVDARSSLPIGMVLPHSSLEGASANADLVTVTKYMTTCETRLFITHLTEAVQAAEHAASSEADEYAGAGERG